MDGDVKGKFRELEEISKIIKRDKQNIPSDILTANISQPDCMYTIEASPKYLYIFQTERLPGRNQYKRKKLFQAVNKPSRSILFIASYRSSVVIKAKLHKAIFLSCSEVHVTLREKLTGSCDFIRCSKILIDCFKQPPSLSADVCELFKIFQRRKRGVYCVTACKGMTLKTVIRDKSGHVGIQSTDLSSIGSKVTGMNLGNVYVADV